MSLYPRGQREVQKSNCKKLEQELDIVGSSIQRNKKIFKDGIDAQREAYELANEPLDYMCPTSPQARQCALEYCEAGNRAQKMWPATGSSAGVPCWPRDKKQILSALTHYITLRAYHVYQSQHRSPNPKPNAVVDQTRADRPTEQAQVSVTLQSQPKSRPNPRPNPKPNLSPAGIAGPSHSVQRSNQVPTPAVVPSPENSLAVAYNLEFERKYADEIKSLDPIHDNRSGPEEFTRRWLSDPNKRWPSEQLYPTIDRRLKRLLLLRDWFNTADLKEIERTSKILRNKSEIQDLSSSDEKEFNHRLAARVKHHVHRFIANGWIVHDNKTNKLRKTEIFSKLWSIYYFKRNHASHDTGEKSTGSNPLILTTQSDTSAAPVSHSVSHTRTRVVQPGPQQSIVANSVPNSAATKTLSSGRNSVSFSAQNIGTTAKTALAPNSPVVANLTRSETLQIHIPVVTATTQNTARNATPFSSNRISLGAQQPLASATANQAPNSPVLNTVASKGTNAKARDGAQSKPSDLAATSPAMITPRASAEHLAHQTNAESEIASQQSPMAAGPPKVTPFTSAPTTIGDNPGSTKHIYATKSIIPTRRRSDDADIGSSQEKRHKPSMVDRASSNIVSFENLATRSSSLFMTPEPVVPIPVNRFRFAEDDIEQGSLDSKVTQVKYETEMVIDTKPTVELTQIPEVPNRSQAPSPTGSEEWRIHDFPRSAQRSSSAGRTVTGTSNMETSSRAARQTTPPTSDDEETRHKGQVKSRSENSPQGDKQRLVFIVEKANGRLDIDYGKNITYFQIQRLNVYQFFDLFAEKSGVRVYQLESLMFTFLFTIGNDAVVEAGDEDEWKQVKERIDVLFKLKSRLAPGLLDFKVVIGRGVV